MGTNFYFKTKCKSFAFLFTDYEVDDDDHYLIHLAKTSCGWLPLFQKHSNLINSVSDIEFLYRKYSPKLKIVDEYGEVYSWKEFDERVIHFNGGVKGAIPEKPILPKQKDKFYDPNLPDHVPISHFEYKMTDEERSKYFKDPEGYEFVSCHFR